MSKPFAVTEPMRHGKFIAKRVIPHYNPRSARAGNDGWVYRVFWLHATKGWRKMDRN